MPYLILRIFFPSRDIDECKSVPRKNGGMCVNNQGSYTCTCNAGSTGNFSENFNLKCSAKVMPYLILKKFFFSFLKILTNANQLFRVRMEESV